jgi:heterodisulfide reductase subunit B
MKPYLYYPGCSLEGTAAEYDRSTRAVMDSLGVTIIDVEDWTCCGATAAAAVSSLLASVLAARNLALAEKMQAGTDLLVPCSACYLNLKKVEQDFRADAGLRNRVNRALSVDGLTLAGEIRVRHLLDILSRDVGPQPVRERTVHPLTGISLAPYYGCQCLRPYAVFDDPEIPTSMEPLIQATGADVFPWPMGGKCCGASHMTTKMDVGLSLSGAILEAAQGADAVVTVCPMCQLNLEAYQRKISRRTGKKLALTVLYLPQVLGLAMGLDNRAVGLDLNLAVTAGFKAKLDQGRAAA